MNRGARTLAALGLVCASAFGASARAQSPPRLVEPGETFGGGTQLEVHAPAGEGWRVRETATELVFGRAGATPRETTIATVSFFDLPESESASPARFVAFVRKMTEAELPPERFSGPLTTFAHSETRGVACVHYSASALDERAPGGPLPQAMIALYCRYPLRTGFGLALVYSQRAKAIEANLAQQAQAFFAGVRVPNGAAKGGGTGSGPAPAAEGAEPAEKPR
jgi:hypothetical protein